MGERVKKLYEEIVDQLMQRIQSGELQPGNRLPSERTLAKEYNVSRSVVREAFRSLERMGCVESQVGGGTYVKTPELSDVVDPFAVLVMQDKQFSVELLETRMLLETEVARLAAERRTEEQILEMKAILREMSRELIRGGDGEEQDLKFHAQLVEAAGNRALKLVVSTCSEILNRTVKITQGIAGVPQQALFDHENILRAVIQQDSAAAQQYMREHLLSARQNLKKIQN